jgi:hypothetical protein
MNSKCNFFKKFTIYAVSVAVCICTLNFCNAKTLDFSGMTWTVKSGRGGPGPCNWSENNAWVDSSGQLHLKISKATDGKWYCGEVYTPGNLGFGEYEWFVIGRMDNFDKNIVLGLFPYGGPDGQNEIDIEMAKWGRMEIGRATSPCIRTRVVLLTLPRHSCSLSPETTQHTGSTGKASLYIFKC